MPEAYWTNNKLMVPRRAEADGIIGDGWVEAKEGTTEYAEWIAWMKAHPSETVKGGTGSGNFGHAGRPGLVGGSEPGGGGGGRVSPEGALGRAPSVSTEIVNGLPRFHTGTEGIAGLHAANSMLNHGTASGDWHKATDAERATLKDTIARSLAEAAGGYDAANGVLEAWSGSSADESPASLTLQTAAAAEFGLDTPEHISGMLDEAFASKAKESLMDAVDLETRAKFEPQLDAARSVAVGKMVDEGVKLALAGNLTASTHMTDDELTNFGLTQPAIDAYKQYVNEHWSISAASSEYFGRTLDSETQRLQQGNFTEDDYRRLLKIPNRDEQQSTVRAMYDQTQSALRSQGIGPDDLVRVYRGTGTEHFHAEPGVGRYRLNPLSSWSVSEGVARGFARGTNGVVLTMDVPARAIASTSATGLGCLTEGELVLLGTGEHEMLVEKA